MLQSKHSEAFLAVAETGSFEQAAIRLNITASAVTLRLQTLEKNLDKCLSFEKDHVKLLKQVRKCYFSCNIIA